MSEETLDRERAEGLLAEMVRAAGDELTRLAPTYRDAMARMAAAEWRALSDAVRADRSRDGLRLVRAKMTGPQLAAEKAALSDAAEAMARVRADGAEAAATVAWAIIRAIVGVVAASAVGPAIGAIL